ncbi:LOW QUALITY PROTEIN: uncharacterized protein [Argopecten irradians]|uniref:LOW QUALITY PROTEIN: uncharacterized protein n=1 Tax=Argopecten irradians TaxID=31199 RepID=UPI003722AADF
MAANVKKKPVAALFDDKSLRVELPVKIGADWKILMYRLGLTGANVDHIDHDYGPLKDKIGNGLVKWNTNMSPKSDLQKAIKLMEALRDAEMTLLADTIEDKYNLEESEETSQGIKEELTEQTVDMETSVVGEQKHEESSQYMKNESTEPTVAMETSPVEDITGTVVDEQLRNYQMELAEDGLRGDNSIIWAGTGSGKTRVAIHIMKSHLDKNPKARVAFFTTTLILLEQQYKMISNLLPTYKSSIMKISGQTKNDGPLDMVLKDCRVCVIMPMALINYLSTGDGSLQFFTMLVFDECHHTRKREPYNQVMAYYRKLSSEGISDAALPQIIGLTATVGTEKASSVHDAEGSIFELMARMNVKKIAYPKIYLAEYKKYAPDPVKDKLAMETREDDPMGRTIQNAMERLENYLVDNLCINDKALSAMLEERPDTLRKEQQYQTWLSRLQDALHSSSLTSDLKHQAIVLTDHLIMYQSALSLNYTLGMQGVLEHLYIRALQLKILEQEEQHHVSIAGLSRCENQVTNITLYKDTIKELEHISKNPKNENPNIVRLQKLVDERFEENGKDSTFIIFTQTREAAIAVSKYLRDNSKHAKCRHLISQRSTEEGCKKQSQAEQSRVVKQLLDKRINGVVATQVAEEGLDIPACDFVIRYNRSSDEISTKQAAGRSRKIEGKVINFFDEKKEKQEQTNERRLELMNEALKNILAMPEATVKRNVAECMPSISKTDAEEERAAAVKLTKSKLEGNFTLKCGRCQEPAVSSCNIRCYHESHLIVIEREFYTKVKCKSNPKQPKFNGLQTKYKIECKKCGQDWGVGALYQTDAFFALLKIKQFIVRGDQSEKEYIKTQWNKLSFSVESINEDELPNLTGFFELTQLADLFTDISLREELPKQIGGEWKTLLYRLGLTGVNVDHIDHDYKHLKDKIAHGLDEWARNRRPKSDLKKAMELMEALRAAEMTCLADKIDEEYTLDEPEPDGIPKEDVKYPPVKMNSTAVDEIYVRDIETDETCNLNLHNYQMELAENGLRGDNSIIWAGTGSGKTRVAIHIMKNHLDKNPKARIAFFNTTVTLLDQQYNVISRFLPQYKRWITKISGQDHKMGSFANILKDCRVCVITPMTFVNYMRSKKESLSLFTMLVFDECHHTRKNEPYNQVMAYYRKLSSEGCSGAALPQIIGLTATVGTEQASSVPDAEDSIINLMARMNVNKIATPQNYKEEYQKHVPDPIKQNIVMEDRENDSIGDTIQRAMEKLEKWLMDHLCERDQDICCLMEEIPDTQRKEQQYQSWLSRLIVALPLSPVLTPELKHQAIVITNHLRMYQNALSLNCTLGMQGVLEHLNISGLKHKIREGENQVVISNAGGGKVLSSTPYDGGLETVSETKDENLGQVVEALDSFEIDVGNTKPKQGLEGDPNYNSLADPAIDSTDYDVSMVKQVRESTGYDVSLADSGIDSTGYEVSNVAHDRDSTGYDVSLADSGIDSTSVEVSTVAKDRDGAGCDVSLANQCMDRDADQTLYSTGSYAAAPSTIPALISTDGGERTTKPDLDTRLYEGQITNVSIFKDVIEELERLTKNPANENPNIVQLQGMVDAHLEEKGKDSTFIVFIQTREAAISISKYLRENSSNVKCRHLISDRSTDDRFQKQSQAEQSRVVKQLLAKQINGVVATQVAEEGLDIPACDFVIRYNRSSDEISTKQAAGRSRKTQGTVINFSDQKKGRQEEMNERRLELMYEALETILQTPDDEIQRKVSERIRSITEAEAEEERAAEELAKSKTEGNFTLRCGRCQKTAVSSCGIRCYLKSQYIVVDREFYTNIKRRHHHKPKNYAGLKTTYKIDCKNCGHDWGVGALHQRRVFCAVVKIKQFIVTENGTERQFSNSSWASLPFTVPPISREELGKLTGFFELTEQDDDSAPTH